MQKTFLLTSLFAGSVLLAGCTVPSLKEMMTEMPPAESSSTPMVSPVTTPAASPTTMMGQPVQTMSTSTSIQDLDTDAKGITIQQENYSDL